MSTLIKYSKTQSTSEDEYLSQKEYVEASAADPSVQAPGDLRTPYTYREWLQRNVGIIPGSEYIQYNEYLKKWHKNTYTVADTVDQVKEDYYALLKELTLAFRNSEDAEYFATLDLDDDLSVEDAIPIFARKLKEICIYFINKRDALKKAKLKYNMVGSRNAIQRLFYEYLLKAFTQRQYVLNVPEQSAYETFPELSGVSKGFQIIINELYDDTAYMDKDPNVDVSTYYDVTTPAITSYFTSLGFDLEALPWLFSTGIEAVHTNNPLLWTLSSYLEENNVSAIGLLPQSAFEDFDYVKLNEVNRIASTNKYMGENLYIISGGYYVLKTKNYPHDFAVENNWFYWPSGEYIRETENNVNFDPIYLRDTSLIRDGAVASNTYLSADRVFTQVGNTISGAWLKQTTNSINPDEMQATLFDNRITHFRFPYPGYGVSGEGIPWSGPQLTNKVLMSEYDENILVEYWDTVPLSSTELLSIHETALVEGGANAEQEYADADKISVRITSNADRIHDVTPDEVYNDDFDRAWLYKMLKTDIPSPVGQTYINWPINTYDNEDPTLPLLILSSQCISTPMSSIDVENTIIGARAGHGVYDSDLIYKLDAPNGYPIECAWLSGAPLASLASPTTTLMYNATGKIQPSFTLRCRPGNFERFVWYDQATDIDNTTIGHHDHQVDCPYILSTHKSIHNTQGTSLVDLGTNGIGDWNDCRCRAIKYSPLGHPGNNYSDYSYMTDVILVDTQFPNKFDIDTWRGTDSLPYNTSKDFAFFHLTSGNNVEPDVGWGAGEWKTGDGSTFQFKPGVVYNYLRANLLRNPGDLIVGAVPDLIIKQQHTSTPSARWMKAVINDNGDWSHTSERSPISLNPGDYLMYDHIDSNWYCLSAEGNNGYTYSRRPSSYNYNSNWANYDFATIDIDAEYLWPSKIYTNGPDHVAAELSGVTWTVTPPVGSPVTIENIDPANKLIFTVEQSGTYVVEATGFGPFGNEALTVFPNLTGAFQLLVRSPSGALNIETTYNDRINMLINIPLSGWNYTTNTFDGTSLGARPFWAKAYDNNSKQTKSKGTIAWGGGIRTKIDDYTFVTQPDIATLSLSSNYYVEYYNSGNDSILWTQPVNFIVNEVNKRWCTLIIDPSVLSPLNDYLLNITNEMIVSATDTTSDILFEIPDDDTMLVNYWSISGFTWTQKLTDSSLGFPPTGGLYVLPQSGLLVEANVPYANLTNRHYPTIATMPYIENVYTYDEYGGYAIPKILGASVYIGKNYTNMVDTSNLSNTVSARGMSSTFRDPEIYRSDYGLTQTTQTAPICTQNIDVGWMKSSVNTYDKSGAIVNSRTYQEFIPYQTKYESTKENFNGLRLQSDKYDPWYKEHDNVWSDVTNFPPNFRNEYNIEGWYKQALPVDKMVYQWKTDIFGNQYALLKDRGINSIYDQSQAVGSVWTRDLLGKTSPASASLVDVFDNFAIISSAVSADIIDNIKNIDIWFDTIMIETTANVLTEKLNFDYEENRIYSIADDFHNIDLSASRGGHFAGTWLFDEQKIVTLCQVGSADYEQSIIYPKIYMLNLNTNQFDDVYTYYNNTEINQMSSVGLSSIEDPVFTYNNNTRKYNISFIGYGNGNGDDAILTSITISPTFSIESVNSVIPTDLSN